MDQSDKSSISFCFFVGVTHIGPLVDLASVPTARPVPPEEDISIPELSIGDAVIDITFHANPAPEEISWLMHDLEEVIANNGSAGRYTSEGWMPTVGHLTIYTSQYTPLHLTIYTMRDRQ